MLVQFQQVNTIGGLGHSKCSVCQFASLFVGSIVQSHVEVINSLFVGSIVQSHVEVINRRIEVRGLHRGEVQSPWARTEPEL